MMRLTTKAGCLAAGALSAAGFIFWPGCAFPPLPAARTPLSIHERDEFALKHKKHPTRFELVTKLGEPDEYFADLRVACYKLNDIKRRRLILLFGFLPMAAPKDPACLEIVMIHFDDHDRAEREKIKIIPSDYWFVDPAPYVPASTIPEEKIRSMMKEEAQWWLKQSSQNHK